jgi:hypothetical protein
VPVHAVFDAVALVACGAAEARFGCVVHLAGPAAARYAPAELGGGFQGGVGVQYIVSVGEVVSRVERWYGFATKRQCGL